MSLRRKRIFCLSCILITTVVVLKVFLHERSEIKQQLDSSTSPERSETKQRLDSSTPPEQVSSHNFDVACSSSLVLNPPYPDVLNLTARAKVWENNARALLDCPELSLKAKQVNSFPFLHRIWECAEVPEVYASSIESWNENLENAYAFLWTEDLRQKYVSQRLGSNATSYYKRLVPGAYRADLFKYVIMYFVGGIYSDLDSTLKQKLSALNLLKSGTTLSIDLDGPRLLPGAIMISSPGNPIFKCAIGEVLDHSAKRVYFEHGSDLDISGPGVLGECLRHIMGQDDLDFRASVQQLESEGYRLLKSLMVNGTHTIELRDRSTLISLQRGGKTYDKALRPECEAGEHYSSLYAKKQIYLED
jgi:hypothetical protein